MELLLGEPKRQEPSLYKAFTRWNHWADIVIAEYEGTLYIGIGCWGGWLEPVTVLNLMDQRFPDWHEKSHRLGVGRLERVEKPPYDTFTFTLFHKSSKEDEERVEELVREHVIEPLEDRLKKRG